MKYRTRFLSVLTAVYFGMFLGIAGSGEHQDRQKGRREGNHQQQQRRQQLQPRHQQNNNQQLQRQQQLQQQPNIQQQRMDRRPNQQLQQQHQQRPQRDVREQRRDRRDGQGRGRHDFGRDHRDYRHSDFRAARHNEHYYRERHNHMRRVITHDHYVIWYHQHREFYQVYYSRPATAVCGVVYNDRLNPYWMCWLQERPRYLAVWVYNHGYEMSEERYEALLRENEGLREQLREMEERGDAVDPNYTPPGVDELLPYSREYIEKYRQR